MSQLLNKTKNLVIAQNIEEARGFLKRSKGLLGRTDMEKKSALWILDCNSIHTFFMKFPLDVIFVDRNLRVKSVYTNVAPWRMIFIQWSASSVFEMAAGQLSPDIVEKGDELSVSN